jgi:putative transposase
MARKPRVIAAGYPHHIVQRGNNKQDIFFEDQDRKIYMDILTKHCVEFKCKVNSFCLMSNHTHLLINPEFNFSISKAMHKIGLRYAQHINRKYGRTGGLWESRFYSSIVSNDYYLYRVLRYIERNPVRSRLVEIPCHYRWSSANYYQSSNGEYGIIDLIWKDESDKLSYVEFLNMSDNQDDVNLIRKCTMSGQAIGTIGTPVGSKISTQHWGQVPNRAELGSDPKKNLKKVLKK